LTRNQVVPHENKLNYPEPTDHQFRSNQSIYKSKHLNGERKSGGALPSNLIFMNQANSEIGHNKTEHLREMHTIRFDAKLFSQRYFKQQYCSI
jgi:hypothetical protein